MRIIIAVLSLALAGCGGLLGPQLAQYDLTPPFAGTREDILRKVLIGTPLGEADAMFKKLRYEGDTIWMVEEDGTLYREYRFWGDERPFGSEREGNRPRVVMVAHKDGVVAGVTFPKAEEALPP